MIRKSDDKSVVGSEVIEVEIVSATFTVYADPPPLRKRIAGVRHFYGGVGHSFCKISIDSSSLLPNEDPDLPKFPGKKIANHCVGFYPDPDMKTHLIDYVIPISGMMRSDDGHEYYSSKSYSIKPSDAKDAISKVVQVDSDKYNVINIGGMNCTSQSSVIAGVAGCKPPSGSGLIWYHAIRLKPDDPADPDNPNGLYGPGLPWRCPNPYVHAIEISKLPGATKGAPDDTLK